MTFTVAQFLPHVGSQFSIPFGDGLSLTLTLDDVKDSTTASSPYHFFSLNFSSNASTALPQGIYALQHASLATQEIFLVPFSKTERGFSYSATFSVEK